LNSQTTFEAKFANSHKKSTDIRYNFIIIMFTLFHLTKC